MDPDDPAVERTWSARTMRPVVALYVAGVFVAFMLMSHFVFHSRDAVKALFLSMVGTVAGLTPGFLGRMEYRATELGVAKRRLRQKSPPAFKDVFTWDELTHVVPTAWGFKFYKGIPPSGPILRFFRAHLSDRYSGEVHVEREDRAEVRALLHRKGIPERPVPVHRDPSLPPR